VLPLRAMDRLPAGRVRRWNVIDFAILLLMYADLFTPPDFTELKGMRPIRLVRLLRRLSRLVTARPQLRCVGFARPLVGRPAAGLPHRPRLWPSALRRKA
jgi:hypothetical protein